MSRAAPPPEWQDFAACSSHPHPEWWFPEGPDSTWMSDEARKICTTCPVRPACLEYALDQEIKHGVWGGTTGRERRRLIRQRRRVHVAVAS